MSTVFSPCSVLACMLPASQALLQSHGGYPLCSYNNVVKHWSPMNVTLGRRPDDTLAVEVTSLLGQVGPVQLVTDIDCTPAKDCSSSA